MDANQAVDVTRRWALQTIVFTLTVDDAPQTNIPREVAEQKSIIAHNLADRLFGEAIVECGNEDSPQRVAIALARKTLEWVVEKRTS